MRIAAVYDRFIRGGGLENYLSDLLSHLVARGHAVDVITARTDASTRPVPPDVRIEKVSGRGLTAAARLRNFDRRAAEAIDRLEPRADVSIGFGRTTAHDLHRAGGGCHKVYSDRFLPITRRLRAKNRAELALERELYTSGRTRHFVCNSQMVAAQISEAYKVESERLSVIRTPVDGAHFRPRGPDDDTRREICAELRTDPDVPVFLFVSLGHRRKGLGTILRTWARIDAHLWIVGSRLGPGHLAEIEKQRIGRKVFHLGSPSDTAPYYRAADFFLHPTLYDACANTALQSMASGLPGLISRHDGAHELVEPGTSGFLLDHPDNPEYLEEVITKALSLDPQARKSMGQAARSQVHSLTWENHLDEWLRLIERIVSTR